MQTRSEWIKFQHDASESAPQKVQLHRVTSPYDVPEAFRVALIEDGRAIIEFRYLDRAEPARSVHLPGDVKVIVGRSTMRLLAIDFRPSDHDVQELIPKIHRIIQQLSEREELKRQAEWNYRATREAVDHAQPSVSSRLADVLQAAPAH